MSHTPEIALLVSSYQRPHHLRRALLSIAMQRDVAGKMEVVVTDDGSTDETPEVVASFAKTVDFPVRFITHPHDGFQLARCRNEGAAASTAPYLLFLDGDCLLPPQHVAIHLERRHPGVAMAGTFARLDREISERINEDVIRRGDFVHWAFPRRIRRLRNKGRLNVFYELIRHPKLPRLVGNNVGIWRADYERVNGYDENFQGWGWEDDDLGQRLRLAGVRIRSILRWTNTFHLWHPTDVTAPQPGQKTQNEIYLHRNGALVCCRNGLVKRQSEDLRLRVVGSPPPAPIAQWLSKSPENFTTTGGLRPEVEILISPCAEQFSGQADCNLLLVLEDNAEARRLARQAHLVVADQDLPAPKAHKQFRVAEFSNALKAVA